MNTTIIYGNAYVNLRNVQGMKESIDSVGVTTKWFVMLQQQKTTVFLLLL